MKKFILLIQKRPRKQLLYSLPSAGGWQAIKRLVDLGLTSNIQNFKKCFSLDPVVVKARGSRVF